MRKFIAVVFPTEAKAYDGFHALRQFHADGTITLYETVVIQREADGFITTKRTSETPMRRTGIGALLGALVGMFGGPLGAFIGLTAGGTVGAMNEAVHWSVSDEYAEDIGKHMPPGSFAVLAELHEKRSGPIDARMAELGGKVLRETRRDFVADMIHKRAQTRRAEVEKHRLAQATEKAQQMDLYVEADFNDARNKLKRTAEYAREELVATQLDLDEKIRALTDQLAYVKPEVRTDLERRMHEIQHELGERHRKLTQALDLAEAALRQ